MQSIVVKEIETLWQTISGELTSGRKTFLLVKHENGFFLTTSAVEAATATREEGEIFFLTVDKVNRE